MRWRGPITEAVGPDWEQRLFVFAYLLIIVGKPPKGLHRLVVRLPLQQHPLLKLAAIVGDAALQENRPCTIRLQQAIE